MLNKKIDPPYFPGYSLISHIKLASITFFVYSFFLPVVLFAQLSNPGIFLLLLGDNFSSNCLDTDQDGICNNADPFPNDPFNTRQITFNGGGHRGVKIDGNEIIWRQGYVAGEQTPAIVRENLITKARVNISDGVGSFIGFASISGGQVIWRHWDNEETFSLYLWELNENTLLTSYPNGNFGMPWGYKPSYWSLEPSISNGEVAWAGWDGHDYEIYYWDGTSIDRITNNEVDDYEPQLDNGQIAWTAKEDVNGEIDGPADVYFWNGETTINVSNRIGVNDEDSHLMNGKIAWTGRNSNTDSNDIYYWDGSTTIINEKPGDDYEPQIDNSGLFMTWHNRNNNQYDIFVWDFYEVIPFAVDPEIDEIGPVANNGNIVFVKKTANGNSDVYVSHYRVDKDGDGVVNGADAYPLDASKW